MKVIRKRVNSGDLAVAGTSAGTAVQCGPDPKGSKAIPMIAGGESFEALVYPSLDHVCDSRDCDNDLQYDKQGGLSLFNIGLLDTHFSQRGRQGRAVKLASDFNLDFAFGVDETTGLLVTYDQDATKFEIFGEYGASLFDLRSAKLGNAKDFSISDVRWSYFTHGDKF
jgi:cyanophycinase